MDFLNKDITQLSMEEKRQAIAYINNLIVQKKLKEKIKNLQNSLADWKRENKTPEKTQGIAPLTNIDPEERRRRKKIQELEDLNKQHEFNLEKFEFEGKIIPLMGYLERLKIILKILSHISIDDESTKDLENLYSELFKNVLNETKNTIKINQNDIRLMKYLHDNNLKLNELRKEYEEKGTVLEKIELERLLLTLTNYRKSLKRLEQFDPSSKEYPKISLHELLDENAELLCDNLLEKSKKNDPTRK